MQRSLDLVDISQLKPADRNAKGHDIPRLRAAIARFGFTDPLLLDERSGQLVAGHGRLAALLEMAEEGEPAPDGIRNDGGQWAVPVVRGWESRDDDHAKAAALALNRLTEAGGWDDDVLGELLGEIHGSTPDLLDVIGWDRDELDMLLTTAAVAPPSSPQDFPAYGDDIDTEYCCPKCGYEWSGKAH